MPSVPLVSAVYALDAVIALMASFVIWRRRDAAGAVPLSGMLLAASFWALCDAIELQVATAAAKQLVSQVQYIGIIACAPCYFEAAIALAGERARLTAAQRLAVWAVPLLSLLAAWTNDLHHWLWTGITLPAGGSPFASYRYGWWFWVLTAQNYMLMIAASAALVRGLRLVGRGFRLAMAVVLMATVLPWIGNAAYNLKLGPWPGLNWLTLSLGLSGWLLVWVVLRGALLDLLPQAPYALSEMMTDGVLVLDRAGRITYSNQAARTSLALAHGARDAVLGVAAGTASVPWQGQTAVATPQGQRWLDLHSNPVLDRWGAVAGRIVVARDVTRQKELEQEREALIEELRAALRRVTQLEGLLPVCAGCHDVRDDAGGWTSMERYLQSRAPVEFTHGICPDCMTRLYPEFADPAVTVG